MFRAPKFWFSKSFTSRLISWILSPLSFSYGWLSRLTFNAKKPVRVDVPVVCVGNIVAGGAGKTPIVLWLAQQLKQQGINPHIILRGYGGNQKTTHQVLDSDTADKVGDEALLYAGLYPTWVGGDRVASAKAAIAKGADLILMDDGFQNAGLNKDFSIIVIDRNLRLGNGFVLPAGPLRESLSFALTRCDCVLISGNEDKTPTVVHEIQSLKNRCTDLGFDGLFAQASIEILNEDANWLKGRDVVAFSGIGHPDKFFTSLRKSEANVLHTRGFADHHFFSEADMDSLTKKTERISEKNTAVSLVTTVKDYVRLKPEMQKICTPIRISVQMTDEHIVLAKLLDVVG